MSSNYVRTEYKNFLTTNWVTTPFIDISDFKTINDLPQPPENVLLLEFVPQAEEEVSVGPGNCYRERGIINNHVLAPSGYASTDALSVCEELRDLLRGIRIKDITVRAVNPPTNMNGAALQFDGSYDGWVIQLDYICDFFY